MESQAPPADIGSLLRHSDWLRSLARGLVRDQAAADDLVQETWLAAMKTPPDPDRPARPWLAGVLRNLARMRARAEGRRSWRQKVSAKRDELPSTVDMIEHVDTQRQLAELVLELTEPYRSTLLLHYYQDLTAVEISRRLDIPASTIRWRLKHGIDDLRGRLDRRYADRKSWCLALGSLANGLREPASAGGVAFGSAGALLFFARLGAFVAALALLAWIPWANLREALAATHDTDAVSLLAADDVESPPAGDPLDLAPLPEASGGHERVTSSVTATRAPMRVRVLSHDGTPAVDLRTVLMHGDGQLEPQRTNGAGWISFPARVGSGDLFVESRSSFPVHMPIELETGDQFLHLDPGNELSGRFLLDGVPPATPMTLRITTNHPIVTDLVVPREVWKELAFGRLARAQTDEEGQFLFVGLNADWKGQLILPDGIVQEGRDVPDYGGPRIHMDGPQQGLVIRARRLPRITGRILEPESRVPVSGAQVSCEIELASGGRSRIEAEADAEGRFELTLRRGTGFAAAHVDFAGPDGHGRRTQSLARAEIPKDLDIGDLELARTRAVEFLVQDGAGEPVAGAVASAEGSPILSEPTDAEGKGVARGLSIDARTLEVRARGYRIARVPLAGKDGETLTITMQATNLLTIRVLDGEGDPVTAAAVLVSCRSPLFLETSSHVPDRLLRGQLLGRWRAGRELQEDGSHVLISDDEGRVSLQGVTSEAPIDLKMVDLLGDTLLLESIEALGAREHRVHVAEVTIELHTLHGSIRDAKDQPIVGADIVLIGDTGLPLKSRANIDGDFLYEDLRASKLHFEVAKRGYARLVFDGLELDGEPLALVLEHGHDVVAHVRDTSGSSVPGGRIMVSSAAGPARWIGDETADGRHEVNGLPGRIMEFTLELGGQTYAKSHDTQAGDVVFDVPRHEPLDVDWELPRGRRAGAAYKLVLWSTAEGRTPLELLLEGSSGQATFPAVLPGTYQLAIERHGAGSLPAGDVLVRRIVSQASSGRGRVGIVP